MRKLLLLFLVLGMRAQAEPAQQLFERTWTLVESSFCDPALSGLDSAAIRSEAAAALENVTDREEAVRIINGYLGRLKTSHTHLYCDQDPLYFELLDVFAEGDLESDIRARFGGEPPSYTGLLMTLDGQNVVDVVPGGPADQAQLRTGDKVMGISNSANGPFEPFHPIRSLLGKAGQGIFLQVQSGLVIGPRKLVPRKIQPHPAFLQSITDSAEVVEQEGRRLGYVRVYSYASQDFQDRLLELLEGPLARAEGLVLDLRGGWGGAQLEYLQPFQPLPEVTLTERERSPQTFTSGRWNRPVVMVVNERSRSGKELMAYGFKKQGMGPLLGTNTAGAVSAGRLYLLPDGCALYLAVAKVTVDGQVLEGVGVAPDEVMEEPSLPTADPTVKERALRRLLEEVRKSPKKR